MSTGDDVIRGQQPRLEILAAKILLVRLAGGRRLAFERDVTAFGANEDLVARSVASRDREAQGTPHCPLGTLAAVVDRRIEDVDACGERACGGFLVRGIIVIIGLSQIGTEPDGRNGGTEAADVTEVVGGEPGRMASREAG